MIERIYITPEGFDNLLLQSDGEVLTGLKFVEDVGTRHAASQQIFHETTRWLDIYFSGHQPDFTPKYRIENLTSFRKDVLEILNTIPFGKTLSYSDIASIIAKKRGIPKMSAQAVGSAVGWNPICIIIPCHRVIGANGSLIGYGGGIKNKEALLRLEEY